MTVLRPTNGHTRECKEDVDLLKLALAQCWPISMEAKEKLIQKQIDIVNDPFVPAIVKVMAVKNIISAGESNLKVLNLLKSQPTPEPESAYAVPGTDTEILEGLSLLSAQVGEDINRQADDGRSVVALPLETARESRPMAEGSVGGQSQQLDLMRESG